MNTILDEILAERVRQTRLHGDQSHLPNGTSAGFAVNAQHARHVCDLKTERGELTFRHILMEEVWEAVSATTDPEFRTELVQVAAVCVQIIEAIDGRATDA